MRTMHYSIHISTSNATTAAKIAEHLLAFYERNDVIMRGHADFIDDNPAAAVHIDTETLPVPDMAGLNEKETKA